MDGGRWTVDGRRWTVDGGRWTVDGAPRLVFSPSDSYAGLPVENTQLGGNNERWTARLAWCFHQATITPGYLVKTPSWAGTMNGGRLASLGVFTKRFYAGLLGENTK